MTTEAAGVAPLERHVRHVLREAAPIAFAAVDMPTGDVRRLCRDEVTAAEHAEKHGLTVEALCSLEDAERAVSVVAFRALDLLSKLAALDESPTNATRELVRVAAADLRDALTGSSA